MKWHHAHFASVLALVGLADARCGGKSDACSLNPIIARQANILNYHSNTCNLKWKSGCTKRGDNGQLEQKPPPYPLCNSGGQPSGQIPVDVYTLAMQEKDELAPPDSADFTLHGLWPGSRGGTGAKNQPYGCYNGEDFDEKVLTKFQDLLNHYWPTNPKFNNTMQCFILSEWMKHGTCAVITGADGRAFRLPQETYFRTGFVFAHEFNLNPALRQRLQAKNLEPLISVNCVQCAYQATVGWKDTTVSSVPRMPSECVDQCFACGKSFDLCPPAFLESTVELDPSNAPLENSESDSDSERTASFPALQFAMPGLVRSNFISPWEGTWRSFGAEQLGSGKFEFAQTFTDNTLTVTTDSPYPSKCTYERRGLKELVLNCEGTNPHLEGCLVQRLPDIGELEAAFLACNHTGEPAPASFFSAMDTPGCGNFLMFRCKGSAEGCAFSSDAIPAPNSKTKTGSGSPSNTGPVIQSQGGIARPPTELLGIWRSLQVSSNYENGLATWNFTADGQASLQWPNYATRGVERYAVSHSPENPSVVLLASASGIVSTCRFQFQYQPVFSYAVLDCEDKNSKKKTQWAMGRCNPCSASCRYSCTPENDNCGYGSCDPADSESIASTGPLPSSSGLPKWCTPDDASCWPTRTAIYDLEQALDPTVPRLGIQWSAYPEPQPAPVPTGSVNNQGLYGLGSTSAGLKALYYYDNIEDMQRPCFIQSSGSTVWNVASEMCKAALHNNEYRNWNPYIVVFPLNERHVVAALKFAAQHRLCIATAGTGHEYNSRNSCPTGGILIRTILFKDKTFIREWKDDPVLAPAGAFKFGAGSIFAEMHAFSKKYKRVIASGWCSTVGMAGFHLGGGHGPFAPSMGLGVDNLLEIEVLQVGRDAHGQVVVHKKIASRQRNPLLFWAMRGGGGGVWGVILSMTIRAHEVPNGGLSHVYMAPYGTFCQDKRKFGYQWLRGMWDRFAEWQLRINQKVSTQPGFFINATQYKKTGDLCSVTWNFTFEYFYAGGQNEADYKLFRDGLKEVLEIDTVKEDNYASAYDYLLTMPPDKFTISGMNPLPAPHEPSDAATGSQNSVFVSREAMEAKFSSTMMKVLDICVKSLEDPDKTSPDPNGYRCGFHYLYTSVTGNLGSTRPADTAIAPGFRSALMLWNARTLSTEQSDDTIYKLGPNSYFSESSYVLHNWTDRYWGKKRYEQLLAVKKAHDPGNLFWCHHCVGDNPDDAYGDPLGIYSSSSKKTTSDKKGGAYIRHDEL